MAGRPLRRLRWLGGAPARAMRRVRMRLPWDARARSITPTPFARVPATRRLFERLSQEDIRAIESVLSAEEARVVGSAADADRERVLLAFAVHHERAEVLAKTGLRVASPPADVHAMGRGALAAGGSYYYADLVADAAARAGIELSARTRALDFGCSSGRVVRVLSAAYPEVEWHACDPNAAAIAWAQHELPGITFQTAPQEPPLPWPAAHFDLVFAISIWTHYSARAALDWLREMERVVRPGGGLVLTTHGYQSVARARGDGVRSSDQVSAILAALYRDGHWFKDDFRGRGDFGIASPDWGNAFLTSEWLLAVTAEAWRLEHFAPGSVEADQDLYVLSRR